MQPASNPVRIYIMLIPSIHKVGVFVDSANIYRNGGHRLQYDVLREFALRDAGQLMRLNAYVTLDTERAGDDPEYRSKTQGFFSALRDFGYKVNIKEVKWFSDDSGNRIPKANSDLDLAVDVLLQSENLDRILLVTGDGDFVQVVRALQNKGCRVEVVAMDNVSSDLKQEADMYMSGYLIPNLIPFPNPNNRWGEVHNRVRGWCYYYDSGKGIGYMRYLARIDRDLWLTDKRKNPNSPYESAFFHFSRLENGGLSGKLPNRELIFEFNLVPSDRKADEYTADAITLV